MNSKRLGSFWRKTMSDSEVLKESADWLSYAVVVGTLTEILPPVAAALAIIWGLIRIYDRWKYGPVNKRDK
jgi:hypothetical protein